MRRVEDPTLLLGRGTYVDDVKLPGVLEVAFVRSPLSHARIVSVDVDRARKLPGVELVLTGAEFRRSRRRLRRRDDGSASPRL